MAATYLGKGYFNGYNGSHFYLELWYEIGSQNIENNTSTFQLRTYVGSQDGYSGSGSLSWIYPHSTTSGIIDESRNCGYYDNIPKNTKVGPGYSDWYTVQHDAQGKASIYVWVTTSCNWSGMGSASAGGTITFPDIPRQSTLVATDAYVEGSTTININRAVDTYKDTITYSFDGLTGTVVSKTSQTAYPWVIPSTFYQKLTTTNYQVGKTCTLTCSTYNEDTLIGTSTATFNVTVNPDSNNTKPTVDATITLDSTTNTLTGATNRVIKGITDATISITATAKNGSSISSKLITCGDGKSLTANGTMTDIESGSFVVSATDARGISNSTTKTLTLVEYVALTLNPTFYRTSPTNNTIALTFTGNYFNDKFGTASSTANTLTVKYRYKLSTASSWGSYTTLSTTKSGNTYSNGSSAVTLGTSFDYTKQYDFEIVATDRIGSVTKSATVIEGIPVFDWGKNDFQFHVPIKQSSGNKVLDFTTVSGDRIKPSDSKYWDATGIKYNTSLLSTVLSNLQAKKPLVATFYLDSTGSSYSMAYGNRVNFTVMDSNCSLFSLSSGTIVVGAGVSKILISANIFFNSSVHGSYTWTEIRKNNNPISISIQTGNPDWASIAHTPKLLSVQEGDVITLYKTGDSYASTFRGGDNTWITIQVVE